LAYTVSLRVAIPEFKQVANQFKLKYGEEFLKAALDNTSCYVNEEVLPLPAFLPSLLALC
jgi:hypothetical protein